MLRKLLAVAATCGLIVSLSVLVPERTRANAAQEKARPLSASEMKGTKGSGRNCDTPACTYSGCDDTFLGTSIDSVAYPKTVCGLWGPFIPGTCTNFVSGICSTSTSYRSKGCAGSAGGSSTTTVAYCGT